MMQIFEENRRDRQKNNGNVEEAVKSCQNGM
jgi:hypothetical protein